jgi:hypothetical protein
MGPVIGDLAEGAEIHRGADGVKAGTLSGESRKDSRYIFLSQIPLESLIGTAA